MVIRIKRVYDEPTMADGRRILIDRLWPRGLTKEKAKIDLWLKDIAPSAELRKWFGHNPERWPEFQKRYRQELVAKGTLVEELRRQLSQAPVTLVFGAKDERYNNAVVLKSYLER